MYGRQVDRGREDGGEEQPGHRRTDGRTVAAATVAAAATPHPGNGVASSAQCRRRRR